MRRGKKSPFDFGEGTGSSPLNSNAGQGYLDNLQKHKNQERMAAEKNQATGGMGGVNTENQQIQQGMSDVDVNASEGASDHRDFNYSQSLQEFQGGDLTNRQKRLISKGKTDKAKNIASRRRGRMLKRGGEVSSSMKKGAYKGEYQAATKIKSESGMERLSEEGGAYNFNKANKAAGASGGFFGRLFGGRG